MECPFQLPVRKIMRASKTLFVYSKDDFIVCKTLGHQRADYIVAAINCHEKYKIACAKAYEGLCTNDLDACDEAIRLLDEITKEAEKKE